MLFRSSLLPVLHSADAVAQDTAAFWESKGQLEKPVKPNGLLDFIGLGPKNRNAGTSGADAEIGPGVYITDDPEMYVLFTL